MVGNPFSEAIEARCGRDAVTGKKARAGVGKGGEAIHVEDNEFDKGRNVAFGFKTEAGGEGEAAVEFGGVQLRLPGTQKGIQFFDELEAALDGEGLDLIFTNNEHG